VKKAFLLTLAALFFIGVVFYFHWQMQEQQALFNVYTLGRYIRACDMIEGQKITSLSDLPDAHIVSYGDSLQFRSEQIRHRVFGGYYYDFQRLNDTVFFVVASPVRPHWFSKEFAMLDDMNVRLHQKSEGERVYSYDEIKGWPIIPVWYDLATVVEK
jgi:hypothetical protein